MIGPNMRLQRLLVTARLVAIIQTMRTLQQQNFALNTTITYRTHRFNWLRIA